MCKINILALSNGGGREQYIRDSDPTFQMFELSR